MIRLYAFGVRVAIAASYLTLAFADRDTAGDIAGPYAALVFAVAVYDVRRYARTTTRRHDARPH